MSVLTLCLDFLCASVQRCFGVSYESLQPSGGEAPYAGDEIK